MSINYSHIPHSCLHYLVTAVVYEFAPDSHSVQVFVSCMHVSNKFLSFYGFPVSSNHSTKKTDGQTDGVQHYRPGTSVGLQTTRLLVRGWCINNGVHYNTALHSLIV